MSVYRQVWIIWGHFVKPGAILTNLAPRISKIAEVVPKLEDKEEILSYSCKKWKKHISGSQIMTYRSFLSLLFAYKDTTCFVHQNFFSLGIEGYLSIIHLSFEKSVGIRGGICSNMSVLRGYFIKILRRWVLYFTLVVTLGLLDEFSAQKCNFCHVARG